MKSSIEIPWSVDILEKIVQIAWLLAQEGQNDLNQRPNQILSLVNSIENMMSCCQAQRRTNRIQGSWTSIGGLPAVTTHETKIWFLSLQSF